MPRFQPPPCKTSGLKDQVIYSDYRQFISQDICNLHVIPSDSYQQTDPLDLKTAQAGATRDIPRWEGLKGDSAGRIGCGHHKPQAQRLIPPVPAPNLTGSPLAVPTVITLDRPALTKTRDFCAHALDQGARDSSTFSVSFSLCTSVFNDTCILVYGALNRIPRTPLTYGGK